MYHSTLEKGRHGNKPLLRTSLLTTDYRVTHFQKSCLPKQDRLPSLSKFPELVQLSPANEVICLYLMCSEQNSTQYFEYVLLSGNTFILGSL